MHIQMYYVLYLKVLQQLMLESWDLLKKVLVIYRSCLLLCLRYTHNTYTYACTTLPNGSSATLIADTGVLGFFAECAGDLYIPIFLAFTSSVSGYCLSAISYRNTNHTYMQYVGFILRIQL